MKIFGNVFLRIIATFVANALGVIGAGAISGVNPVISASLGGILAVAEVIRLLSIAFLEDGKLSSAEINAAFTQTLQLKGASDPASVAIQAVDQPSVAATAPVTPGVQPDPYAPTK
jgi:hypothetical protein